MSELDRGPRDRFEITWMSGHVETIEAHPVSYPSAVGDLFGLGAATTKPRRIEFHGEFDGHWQLVLSVREDDLRTLRNLSRTEEVSS